MKMRDSDVYMVTRKENSQNQNADQRIWRLRQVMFPFAFGKYNARRHVIFPFAFGKYNTFYPDLLEERGKAKSWRCTTHVKFNIFRREVILRK
jgi:hypothetical protein